MASQINFSSANVARLHRCVGSRHQLHIFLQVTQLLTRFALYHGHGRHQVSQPRWSPTIPCGKSERYLVGAVIESGSHCIPCSSHARTSICQISGFTTWRVQLLSPRGGKIVMRCRERNRAVSKAGEVIVRQLNDDTCTPRVSLNTLSDKEEAYIRKP